MSLKQTSETVSAKRRVAQIITLWVPGSRASNSKCPSPIRTEATGWWRLAERRCRRLATSETGMHQSIKYRGALWWRQLCTIDASLNLTRSGMSSQCRSTCISCVRPRRQLLYLLHTSRRAKICSNRVVQMPVMPWLQLRFDYDTTTIRLRRIARACFYVTHQKNKHVNFSS